MDVSRQVVNGVRSSLCLHRQSTLQLKQALWK